MTIIEFYDKASIENIAGALLCEPDRVVLIGSNNKHLARSQERYQKILASRGILTDVLYMQANKNDLKNIVDKLSGVVECYGDCVLDLTGGEELHLVAAGMVMGRYGDKVQCHRFNFRDESLIDCDADGTVCAVKAFDISVEENISIYGGEVVTDPQKAVFTYPWDFSDSFVADIQAMWEICRQNPRMWNSQMGTIGAVCQLLACDDPLAVSFEQEIAARELGENRIKYTLAPWILYALEEKGLIKALTIGDTVSFSFKNEQVKRCLTVAGQILELVIASKLRALRERDGSPLYHDVRVGVVIDWDGCNQGDEYDTINEIDIIAMKGAVPIFISCKNGYFDANELYKLNTVAERFGYKYAKKVVVATEMDKLGVKAEYLLARMGDMGIRCLNGVDVMSDSELSRALKSLWIN